MIGGSNGRYARAGLEPEAAVEMALVDGSLVVTSLARGDVRMAEMLAQVGDENLYGEVGAGPAVDVEAWRRTRYMKASTGTVHQAVRVG